MKLFSFRGDGHGGAGLGEDKRCRNSFVKEVARYRRCSHAWALRLQSGRVWTQPQRQRIDSEEDRLGRIHSLSKSTKSRMDTHPKPLSEQCWRLPSLWLRKDTPPPMAAA